MLRPPLRPPRPRIDIDDDTLAALAHAAGGDARIALNALELAVQTAAHVGAPLAAPRRHRGAARPEAT